MPHMSQNELNNNLDNIQTDVDLFGNRIDRLSMKERIGFVPISIWQPNWNIVSQLKVVVGDAGESRKDCFENAPACVRGGGGGTYI